MTLPSTSAATPAAAPEPPEEEARARARSRGGAPPTTPCPACDAPVQRSLARAGAPRCPTCGTPLIPARVAGTLRRLAAGALDGAILALSALPLHLALMALVAPPPLLAPTHTPMGAALELLAADPVALARRLSPLLAMTYLYLVLHWSALGATPGARLMGLRVLDPAGRPPSPARALLRAAAHLVGLLPAGLGWLWAAFDREHRAFHDKVSNTLVIREGAAP